MENPYAGKSSLVLTETLPDSVYRKLLSKNLTTTTTQFNAELNGTNSAPAAPQQQASPEDGSQASPASAAGGGLKGAYLIKTTIKSPAALLHDVDTETSLGLTAVDALAALFPPTPAASTSGLPSHSEDGESGPIVNVARLDHADRMDVINLQERILQLLEEGKAKPVGICPVREGVYDSAFEELIRQTAVLCPERGLLISELRNEMRETDTTYDLLFDTACQYAVRKAISRDLGRTMLQETAEIGAEVRTAENRVSELRAKYEGQQKRAAETRAAAQKVHEEEIAFIKRGTQQLTQEIKRLTAQQQQQ
eukprot:GILI01026959.1.p1 GENE.GILI01026959.1~~GILI01026959.1.p1  ORF type:complete len:309 (-),score=86.08 GILI01026959.1:67-993(-)